jgi:hypothetical protein
MSMAARAALRSLSKQNRKLTIGIMCQSDRSQHIIHTALVLWEEAGMH